MKKTIVLFGLVLLLGLVSAVCEDADSDGYGKQNFDCSFEAIDCDDSDAGINPGMKEICGNRIDEDCSGTDKTCIKCADGPIYFRCSCEGTIHKADLTNPEYCCNNTFNGTTQCEWCTEPLSEKLLCTTEQGCAGERVCMPPGIYTRCYDKEDNCPCIEEWNCTQWSDCTNEKRTRTCTDKSSCKTINFKPATQVSCLSEIKEFEIALSSTAIKEKQTLTLTVFYQNQGVSSATIQYAGKTLYTGNSGKINLTAVLGEEKIRISKPGFDTKEVNITVLKEYAPNICGDGFCDSSESETSCPADCKKPDAFNLVLTVPEKVIEGAEFTIKVTNSNGSPAQGKKIVYAEKTKYTDAKGNAVFTAEKNFTSVRLIEEKTITKNISIETKEKSECGNRICETGENIDNCSLDCSNPALPENFYLILVVVLVFIFFAVFLLSVK